MTTYDGQCLLSVRADAERTVNPDAARLQAAVRAVDDAQDGAVRRLRDELITVTSALADLGGVVHRAETARVPLMWTARHFHLEDEHTDGGRRTGRRVAAASLTVIVRDFDLLSDVTAVMTTRDAVDFQGAWWSVDADNRAWLAVRADAIAAAMRKGQDYAAALGGRIERVEHVADAGLLGDSGGGHGSTARALSRQQSADRGAQDLGPVMEPEPQTLTAMIDARFTTTVGALPQRDTTSLVGP